jgi:type II secretory pathway pseudopilin PulG
MVAEDGQAPGRGRRTARGFTLVEAAITVAILALAVGVVLANWTAGRGDLRSAAGGLCGTIRAAYDNAALSGQTHRLRFDFQSHVVKVEATEQALAFDEDSNPLVRGAQAATADPLASLTSTLGIAGMLAGTEDANARDDALDELEDQGPPSALSALLGVNREAEGEAQATFASTEHDLDLGADVRLLGIWLQGMREAATEGEIFLYFFANGYTQDAMVYLEDEEGAVFTVRVHALTGKTEVFGEYVEVPKA